MSADQPRFPANLIQQMQQRIDKLERLTRELQNRPAVTQVWDFANQYEPIPVDGALAIDYTGEPADEANSTATHNAKYGFNGAWHPLGGQQPYAYAQYWKPIEPVTYSYYGPNAYEYEYVAFSTSDASVFSMVDDGFGSADLIGAPAGFYAVSMSTYITGVTGAKSMEFDIRDHVLNRTTRSVLLLTDEMATTLQYTYDNSFRVHGSGHVSSINPGVSFRPTIAAVYVDDNVLNTLEFITIVYVVLINELGLWDIE